MFIDSPIFFETFGLALHITRKTNAIKKRIPCEILLGDLKIRVVTKKSLEDRKRGRYVSSFNHQIALNWNLAYGEPFNIRPNNIAAMYGFHVIPQNRPLLASSECPRRLRDSVSDEIAHRCSLIFRQYKSELLRIGSHLRQDGFFRISISFESKQG